ncbi:MAG: tRNA (N(6)-L-threonylcarbamoyladenosine(37)-C(2))-methylthiotransferase MtaB [Sulfurimonas sp. RIFOXYD12_FULL_33_39]|uniref:tRNA (N(6)-L-threonylcarbamoyladenosine(37)-C(2))- methylthiotransferase MtaB n=1 Tax=unclassified Sulfurimonas TaxID=2623549 RepID=UPI0008BD061D|nr:MULTISPECIES: tRNA (N(6)-L-threonylcarbamoyladenosine(37)-C(2))-methylthiotransferase MtaB [unclassified Sulfurimonas]OHE09497.1 MAG: tRNA (N(6)-L-threonylcarbamoyladenosine(37)-C(2))-methylthiotransferase MtaB [Sulfurimonas sp. RIFOXYD12_FULL_33_39]OHE12722.1 MAG: tRNA (N(6)-L-threonylcarbamoyladenosine(37)-C(2))-methylthiotransferase MtaB [Sulfurimonas sp. RIFOXYD2_FULL_34_21]DAB28590.1 MAG TPA: tRNA (N(6)-L-threonylcarbamoyladenosine(37)-C(2))-methylthiotransferase MtaB [Sulfurimonas sp. U
MKKVYFKTFGCRTNLYDSQVMMSAMQEYEVTEIESEADVVVINSCTVTNGADSHVRSYISHVENSGGAKIFLTGCGAHTKGEKLLEQGRVAGVFGQSEKLKIDELLNKEEPFYEPGDLNYIDEAVVDDFVGKSRAFIKIQEGCSFRCSYCIIPHVRGDARSMDESKILEQIEKLARNGFGEFILTGTNVGSYGQKTDSSIASLMKKISQIRGVRRIRLGSVEPIQITDEFKEILGEPWLEKHLHIALQHTSPQMLKFMNRRNVYKQDRELFELLATKGFAIGTDFITGHPGETQALWDEAMKNVRDLPLTHLHAFTYSKRDNTPSATMKPEVNGSVAKERLHELESIVEAKNFEFRNAFKGNLDILVESEKEGLFVGYDQHFNKILIDSDEDLIGNWVNLEDYEVKKESNYGRV